MTLTRLILWPACAALALNLLLAIAALLLAPSLPAVSQLTYVLRQPGPDGAAIYRLHLHDTARNLSIELAPGTQVYPYVPPVWSPDGERIAFVIWHTPPFEAYIGVVDMRGGLVESAMPVNLPDRLSWSPDGRRIPVTVDDQRSLLGWINTDSGALTLLDAGLVGRAPAWSPALDRIAYHGLTDGWAIMALDVSTGEQTRLAAYDTVQSPDMLFREFARVAPLLWSPDGRYLALSDTPDRYAMPNSLLVDLETGAVYRLPRASNVTWGPDGEQIVYVTAPVGGGEPVIYRLALTENAEAERVTPGYSPVWSPDGERLLLARTSPFGQSWWWYDWEDGSEGAVAAFAGRDVFSPVWRP